MSWMCVLKITAEYFETWCKMRNQGSTLSSVGLRSSSLSEQVESFQQLERVPPLAVQMLCPHEETIEKNVLELFEGIRQCCKILQQIIEQMVQKRETNVRNSANNSLAK